MSYKPSCIGKYLLPASCCKPDYCCVHKFFMYNRLLIFIILFILFGGNQASGQSLPGTTGYFNMPSADFQKDKSFFFGFNRSAKKYQDYANGEYDINIFYATVTYLEFLELSIRYSRLDGFDPPGRKQAGDRMGSARIRPVAESKYFPAVVIGFQNFFTTLESGAASHFNSTYIVATKNFEFDRFFKQIGVSAGYGSDIFNSADYQFIGVFGGIRLVPHKADFLELMLEYDADKWNAGARITLFNRLSIAAGLEGLDSFSGGIAYHFMLP